MARRLWFWLVAVGVLAVGFSFVMPAVKSSLDVTARSRCQDNLRQIGLALHGYHAAYGCFPPGTVPNARLSPERELSWVVAGWGSGLGGGALRLDVDQLRAWDEPPNRAMTATEVGDWKSVPKKSSPARPIGQCPARALADQPGVPALLAYVGLAGKGPDAPWLPANHERAGMFGYDRVTRIQDITDGTSGTMMVIETLRDNGPWTAGGLSSIRAIDPATRPHIGPVRPFGGYHRGGVNVLLADGSVKFIKETIDPLLFEAVSTIAGGEVSGCDCY